MLLEADGILNIGDPVTKHLKNLPELFSKVTIRHLLSHTSGIREMNQEWQSKVGLSNIDVYNYLINMDSLEFPPGSEYSYSNTGFNLLAILIDSLSGTTYREFVETRLFQACGMEDSFVRPEKNRPSTANVVKSYIEGEQADWPLYTCGAGGVYTTALDMYIWDRAFFSGKVLGQDKMSVVLERVGDNNGGYHNYGLGWGVYKSGGFTSVGHTGGMFGFRTLYERVMENGITIIILTNIGDETPIVEIRNRILQLIIG
jgi:CubicO group peptidase (beta-lactamase class C family)